MCAILDELAFWPADDHSANPAEETIVALRPAMATIDAFVDPSGGSHDSFTLAIAHREDKRASIDAIRERKPPFSAEAVVEEFCVLPNDYRVRTVVGDRYAGEWPREQFGASSTSPAICPSRSSTSSCCSPSTAGAWRARQRGPPARRP